MATVVWCNRSVLLVMSGQVSYVSHIIIHVIMYLTSRDTYIQAPGSKQSFMPHKLDIKFWGLCRLAISAYTKRGRLAIADDF